MLRGNRWLSEDHRGRRRTPYRRLAVVLAVKCLFIVATVGPAVGAQVDAVDARGMIIGHVVDSEGMALPGTVVRISELGRTELTHADGRFMLRNVTSGRYTLVFERLGYRRHVELVDVTAGRTVSLEIRLQVSAVALPGVVVTGTPGARSAEEALLPTTVLFGQELAARMDATLGAMLDGQPGMAAVSTGPATARPIIRGMGGDRILILEDGDRVGDLSATGPDHAVAIEPISARRIEVVRGPAALLYGSNALGGVINVIREEVPGSLMNGPHGSATLQGQSANRSGAVEGSMAGSIGRLALRGEGTLRTAGDLRTPSGVLSNSGLDTYSLSTGIGWIEHWGHTGAAYRYYQSSYGVPGDSLVGHPGGVSIDMTRLSVRGEARVRDVPGFLSAIELRGNYSHYQHGEYDAAGVEHTAFALLSGGISGLAHHNRLGPFSEGAVGLQTRWYDYAARGMRTPPVRQLAAAGFVFQEIDLDPIRLHVGGRYDWSRVVPAEEDTRPIGQVRTRTFGSVSGSLGVLYKVSSFVGLGASLARAFRTPDMNELFSEGPHLAVYSYEVGNPDLADEVGTGADLFVRVTGASVQADVAVYRNALRGYIFPRPTGDTSAVRLPIYQFTGEDAVLVGAEGQAAWNVVPRIVLSANASFTRGTLRSDAGREPLPAVPPLAGRFGIRYESTSNWIGGSVRAAARQDRVARFESHTAGYTVFDLQAGHRRVLFGRIHSVSLRVDNLTNTVYRDHLSRVRHIMPQPGRSATLLYRVLY